MEISAVLLGISRAGRLTSTAENNGRNFVRRLLFDAYKKIIRAYKICNCVSYCITAHTLLLILRKYIEGSGTVRC